MAVKSQNVVLMEVNVGKNTQQYSNAYSVLLIFESYGEIGLENSQRLKVSSYNSNKRINILNSGGDLP